MRGYHDIGGLPGNPIEAREHIMAFWERRMEAMPMIVLVVLIVIIDRFSFHLRRRII